MHLHSAKGVRGFSALQYLQVFYKAMEFEADGQEPQEPAEAVG